ncbi:MAG: hypothetical protein ACYC1M_15555 [Armatimonadota bacterium]
MRKSQIGLNVCWILMSLSFLWPTVLLYLVMRNYETANSRWVIGPILYTVTVIVQGIVVGRGLYLQKRWAIISSIVPTAIAFIITVPGFLLHLAFMLRYGNIEGPNGEGSPLAFIFYLLLGAPVAIGTLLYITSLVLWWKKARQLARYTQEQAGG